MDYKEIIPRLRLGGDKEITGKDVLQAAADYGNNGADRMLVFIEAGSDKEWDDGIEMLRKICQTAEIPVMASGRILRMEDVKKILYAGCEKAVVDMTGENRDELLEEVSKKFGKDQIIAETAGLEIYNKYEKAIKEYASTVLCMGWYDDKVKADNEMKVIYLAAQNDENKVIDLLKNNKIDGITGESVSDQNLDFMKLKREYKKEGIYVDNFESAFQWKDFKLNSDGMIPVIVQDYKTDEVLMMAYMNEEAYENTLLTGRMTYWSRSRNELWVKGLTSGHFQYVKSMTLDCDNDTILAKVSQIGAACHTGSRSCFYQPMMKKPYDDTNPLNVFQDVYDVIKDRKVHPREGSYTNYLFNKGIDKILKKVGEECTEVVIAAKNDDPVEITYEISDLLYHMMVLMAERGLGWEEITRELARR